MIGRFIELLILANALVALGSFGVRHLVRRRRRLSNVEHVEQLAAENERIDRELARMRRGRR